MTNSKNTKRALLASVLSVALCAAMLVSSTFAWFTDSVTSAGNIIKSGTLDVTMEWANGTSDPTQNDIGQWQDASEGAIFDYDLWEPGYTEVRHVRISNVGSLALKYEVRIAATGEVSELADVIDVYYIKNGNQITDRTQLNDSNKIGTLTEVLAKPYAAKGNLFGKKGETVDYDVATIALKMQESAGNEYQGKSIGSEFAIQLVATQDTVESDSFGPDYDKGAAVTTQDELLAAVENGGNVILWDDITLAENVLEVAADTTLNLNGRTITFGADYSGETVTSTMPIQVQPGGSLTITGNGTIDASSASDYVVPVNTLGGDIVIENGTFIVDTPRESCVFAYGGGSVTIYDGTFINRSTEDYEYGDSVPLTLNVSNGNPGDIAVYGGTFVGRDPADGDDNLGGTFVAEGYQSTKVSEGKYVVTDVNTTPAADSAALNTAIQDAPDGGAILVTEDVTASSTMLNLVQDKAVTVNLNGNVLTYTGTDRSVQLAYGAEMTIRNGTINMPNVNEKGAGIFVYGTNIDETGKETAPCKLTMEGVTVNSSCLGVFSQGSGNEININDCVINSNYWGIYQNGSNSPSTFNITNSTIKDTAGAGVYISNSSADNREKQTLNITNSTVIGPTAVEIKHTNATITDSTLIGTATPTGSGTNNNGSCTTGYALAVTTNGTEDYVTGTVTVSDCKFYNGETSEGVSNGYCFVYTVADGSSVTIDGKAVSDYNTYGGETGSAG